MRRYLICLIRVAVAVGAISPVRASLADEPKPKPENTISIHVAEPVKPQGFARPIKFFVADVVDRSGNPQPMLVYKPRGGVFLDRQPTQIAREALEESLKAAGLLAADRDSCDFLLTIYVFHFGLGNSSGMDFFGKVEWNIVVKNVKTGKSQQVTASGTSIAGVAILKKNLQKNVQTNIEMALSDAMRNFLRGTQLREAIAALDAAPPTPSSEPAKSPPAQGEAISQELGEVTRR